MMTRSFPPRSQGRRPISARSDARSVQADESKVDDVAKRHLERFPKERRFVERLLASREYELSDEKYLAWLRYNLNGIDNGRRLVTRMESVVGSLKGKRVLDVGAGGGGNAIAFAEHGCEVTALELDRERLDWLHTRVSDSGLPVEIVDRPLESLPVESRYDFIICNAVLEHVEDWRNFLAELVRRLAAGGIYLAWPNRSSLIEIWADQHYGLFGAVFLTGRLRWLQAPYLRLRGVHHDAWVTTVPPARAVRRQARIADRGIRAREVDPEGIDKISDPERVNHPVARRFLRLAGRLRVPPALLRWIVRSQKPTRELMLLKPEPLKPAASGPGGTGESA